MITTLQAFTVVVLLGWPAYNLAIALLALRPTPGSARLSDPLDSLEFWIVIPALNEASVIANTVHAALALATPTIPARVLVVDDGSDDGTGEVISAIADPRLRVLRRDAPLARQGKGEALNAGYREIRAIAAAAGTERSTIVGVMDGDGRGDPGTLRSVAALFADRQVGAVQCRVRIQNRRRLLGLLQDIEFACVANASQSLRDRFDSVGMGGNGQFVRLTELISLGHSPWSSCLVEDLELGLRLHLEGVSIRYASTTSTSQQAVVDLRRLLRQRTRWAQGNIQCARYARRLAGSHHITTFGLLDFLYYLMAPWFTVPLTLVVLTATSVAVIGLTTGATFGGLIADQAEAGWAIALWASALALPGLMWGLLHRWRIADEPLWRCLVAGLCYPAFLVLGVLATWRALGRHISRRDSWVKTERVDESRAEPVPSRAES